MEHGYNLSGRTTQRVGGNPLNHKKKIQSKEKIRVIDEKKI